MNLPDEMDSTSIIVIIVVVIAVVAVVGVASVTVLIRKRRGRFVQIIMED